MSQAIVQSSESIFFNTPEKLMINEDAKTRYSTSFKLDTLIQELQEKGPLVAFGYLGPNCYSSAPFPLEDRFGDEQIFGWQPGTRTPSIKKTYAIVVGARKVDDKEYVYFTLSKDYTSFGEAYIREHRPTEDSRVYMLSHRTFSDHLFDLYPPVSNREKKRSNVGSSDFTQCSPAELMYVQKLVSIMPLEAILGPQASTCKALGQEIFDTFKNANDGNAFAGMKAVAHVYDAIEFYAKDGSLRKQYVDRAWDGVGDNTWCWHC